MVQQPNESQWTKERRKPKMMGTGVWQAQYKQWWQYLHKNKNQTLKNMCRILFTRWVDILPPLHQIMNVTQNKTKQQETTCSRKKKQLELHHTKQKILSGQSPCMVTDSGATSSCGQTREPFIKMRQPLTKRSHMPLRQMMHETEMVQLQHKV